VQEGDPRRPYGIEAPELAAAFLPPSDKEVNDLLEAQTGDVIHGYPVVAVGAVNSMHHPLLSRKRVLRLRSSLRRSPASATASHNRKYAVYFQRFHSLPTIPSQDAKNWWMQCRAGATHEDKVSHHGAQVPAIRP